MKHMHRAGTLAAAALVGLVPACAAPPGTPAAASPTPAAASASTAQASAPSSASGAPATAGNKSRSAPPAGAAGGAAGSASAAGSAAAAGPATPVAPTGTISGRVTTSPAKYGKHVVVWLDSGGLPAKPKTIEINQKNMKFLPYLNAIPVGGRVIFHNSDPFPHNVFSPDGAKFNLGMMPANSARSHVFKQAGPYTLLCHIHPGMIAYLYVVPSRYYAIADWSGHYTIHDVPNGTYRLSAWAPRLATSTKTVNVSGRTATVAFHLHRGG